MCTCESREGRFCSERNRAPNFCCIRNAEAKHLALADFNKKVFLVSSVGLTEEHSVDSGQEEEDEGHGVVAEES